MLKTAHSIIEKTAKRLGLSQEQTDFLFEADDEFVFDIEIGSGDDTQTFKAYRIQHNSKLGPNKGGVRFHPEVDLDEARALATLMTLKTAAVGLPLGGGKGGVAVDVRHLNDSQLEEISRKYAAHLSEHIGPGKDVPAPDVNTNAKIIDWMVDEFESITSDNSGGSFTGKSIENRGSLGRKAATGRGGYIALKETLDKLAEDKDKLTVAVQGFGNVGYWFAKLAEDDPRFDVIAIADSGSTLVSTTEIDNEKVFKCKKEGGAKTVGDCAEDGQQKLDAHDVLSQKVDVLVLAALGDAVTEHNVDQIKAKYILELANGPVNEAAHDTLTQAGTVVIPDIIANSGGVIVSYLEMLQNAEQTSWSEDDVNKKLNDYMVKAVDAMTTTSKNSNVSLKEAAFEIGIKKLV